MKTTNHIELYDEGEDVAEFGGRGSCKDEVNNLVDSPELKAKKHKE